MLREKAAEYFLLKDNNCAETTLRVINDGFELGLSDKDITLVSAFGGGMGCSKTCGVLCACMAAYGRMAVADRAHATAGFRDLCAELYNLFLNELGSTQCAVLKNMYRDDTARCLEVVEKGIDCFEHFAADKNLI